MSQQPPPNPYAETRVVSGHTVTIYSNPQLGAEVEFDGQVRGRTPIILRGIESGFHTVKLRLEGFAELIHPFDLRSNTYLDLPLQAVGTTQVPHPRRGFPLPLVFALAVIALLLVAGAAVAALFLTRGGAPASGSSVVVLSTAAPLPTAPPRPPGPTVAAPSTTAAPLPTPELTPTPRPKILPTATLARALDRTSAPVNPTAVFEPDDGIFVSAETGSLPAGATVRILILADRIPGIPPNYELARSEIPVGPGGRVGFGLLAPPEGWPVGRYRANLFVGDTLDHSLEFQVR
jgi:hypothetical protein